jgi:hypothetical protein
MNYLLLIWADGMPTLEQLAVLQRELPGWDEEMTRRGTVRRRAADRSAGVRVRARRGPGRHPIPAEQLDRPNAGRAVRRSDSGG